MSVEPCENEGYRRFPREHDLREEKGGTGFGRRAIRPSCRSDRVSLLCGISRAKTADMDVKLVTAGGCQLTVPLTAGQ